MEKKWDTVITADLKRLCKWELYVPLVTKRVKLGIVLKWPSRLGNSLSSVKSLQGSRKLGLEHGVRKHSLPQSTELLEA
jgi:hypothetical protein